MLVILSHKVIPRISSVVTTAAYHSYITYVWGSLGLHSIDSHPLGKDPGKVFEGIEPSLLN